MSKFLVTGGVSFVGGNFLHIMVNRYPNDQYVCIDALTKLETELGWKPEYNFDSGIQETIKWNLNHQDWINHVESVEYMKWMERYE